MVLFKILHLTTNPVNRRSPFAHNESNEIKEEKKRENKSMTNETLCRKRLVLLFYSHDDENAAGKIKGKEKEKGRGKGKGKQKSIPMVLISGFTTLDYPTCLSHNLKTQFPSSATVLHENIVNSKLANTTAKPATVISTKEPTIINSSENKEDQCSIVHFDKLDTTGLEIDLPKNSVRYLVQSFLLSVPHLTPSPSCVYLYAKSAPEYLFFHSEKNPNKHLLQGKPFLTWWKNTLSCFPEACSTSTPTSVYFYSPGNPHTSPVLLQEQWHYNLPWKPDTSTLSIPLFPDDELSRLVTSQKDILTVHDLVHVWDTLAAPWTAYIAIDFHPPSTASSLATLSTSYFPCSTNVDIVELDTFVLFFTNLDFGPANGHASSQKVLDYIEKKKWKLEGYDDRLLRQAYEEKLRHSSSQVVNQVSNDISTFVKKKNPAASYVIPAKRSCSDISSTSTSNKGLPIEKGPRK